MLLTSKFIFIHAPKTGGMSITKYLLNSLTIPSIVYAPENARQSTLLNIDISNRELVQFEVGKRHENANEAIKLVKKYNKTVPPLCISIIRNPVDLMISYYYHLRKPATWKVRSLDPEKLTGPCQRAMNSSLNDFCRSELFYGMNDKDLLKYYQSSYFHHIVLPIDYISRIIPSMLRTYVGSDLLPHVNQSKKDSAGLDINPSIKAMIELKYPSIKRLFEESLLAYQHLTPVLD